MVDFGCEFCRDDQNRLYGYVTQIASDEERQRILLRCPRCTMLYENSSRGTDETRRVSSEEARRLYPGAPIRLSPTGSSSELRSTAPGSRVQAALVNLAFDGAPEVRTVTCPSCGRGFPFVSAFVNRDGSTVAVVYALCHAHNGDTAWFDVVVGSFEPGFADQATFSCHVDAEGVTLFQGPVAAEGRAPFFGKKLTADEAKAHERLSDVWAVVEFVVASEPTIRATVYGTNATP